MDAEERQRYESGEHLRIDVEATAALAGFILDGRSVDEELFVRFHGRSLQHGVHIAGYWATQAAMATSSGELSGPAHARLRKLDEYARTESKGSAAGTANTASYYGNTGKVVYRTQEVDYNGARQSRPC